MTNERILFMNQPNILILHLDELRQDCLGCYGNPDIQTPNIDALAADGVTYQNHYTVYPVCTPSRYSLFSSLYVHQHAAWDNHCTLPSGYPTFPKLLRENGYQTTAVGKMHMTPTYLDIGFSDLELTDSMTANAVSLISIFRFIPANGSHSVPSTVLSSGIAISPSV